MKYSKAIKRHLEESAGYTTREVKHALRIAVQALELYDESFWKRTLFFFRKNLYSFKFGKKFDRKNYRYFEHLVPDIGKARRNPSSIASNALKKIQQICNLKVK